MGQKLSGGYNHSMSGDNGIFELIEYNARFYSPSLHRFTQPDTIIPSLTNSQDWNRYSYVRNNPLNYVDPSGHLLCSPHRPCGPTPDGGDDGIESDLDQPLTTKDVVSEVVEATVGHLNDIANRFLRSSGIRIPVQLPTGFDDTITGMGALVDYTIAKGSTIRKIGGFIDGIPGPVTNVIGWTIQVAPAQIENTRDIFRGEGNGLNIVADFMIDGAGILVGEGFGHVGKMVGGLVGGGAGAVGGGAPTGGAGALPGGLVGGGTGAGAGSFALDVGAGLIWEAAVNSYDVRDKLTNIMETYLLELPQKQRDAFPNITPVPSP